jgi:ABC-2 type transport system permease protein
VSLWRLEWLRLVRTRRLLALAGIYAFFGFLGPLSARYMGDIIDRFSGQVTVIVPDPVPADGIAQFSANVQQIGLLVAVIVAAGSLSIDALPEMSAFLRTRVHSAWRILLPRAAMAFGAAAGSFLLGSGIAWYETRMLLGSVPAWPLLAGIGYGVAYLGFVIAVVCAASGISRTVLGTVSLSLVTLLALPLLGLVEPLGRWLPSHLVGALDGLVRQGGLTGYLGSLLVTLASSAILFALGVRRQAVREL